MSADRLLFAGLPAALTLLLHGGLILILVVRGSGANEVVAAAPAIQPIQATLVQAETLKPRPQTTAPTPKPKPKPEPKPKPSARSDAGD